jgi:hypothetical protein
LYTAGLPEEVAGSVRIFWRAWNAGRATRQTWSDFWQHRAVLQAHALSWSERLAAQGDLASHLVNFCHKLVK